MAENRPRTIMRADDRRLATGTRLLFNRQTEIEALLLSRLALRLSPERCRQLRLLGECMQVEDAIDAPGPVDVNMKGGA